MADLILHVCTEDTSSFLITEFEVKGSQAIAFSITTDIAVYVVAFNEIEFLTEVTSEHLPK